MDPALHVGGNPGIGVWSGYIPRIIGADYKPIVSGLVLDMGWRGRNRDEGDGRMGGRATTDECREMMSQYVRVSTILD